MVVTTTSKTITHPHLSKHLTELRSMARDLHSRDLMAKGIRRNTLSIRLNRNTLLNKQPMAPALRPSRHLMAVALYLNRHLTAVVLYLNRHYTMIIGAPILPITWTARCPTQTVLRAREDLVQH
jgi:hypothetical protein